MPGEPTLTWVVGGSGLLGSSVVSATSQAGGRVWRQPAPIDWRSPQADAQVEATTRAFVDAAGDGRWRVAWCAGAGVTGTRPEELRQEADRLRTVLAVLRSGAATDRGALFLASSAGGVYAGGERPPFDEHSRPAPISAYGEAKLEVEELVTEASRDLGLPTLVGRISNLYGPGQDMTKAQGLIPHLARAVLVRRPLSIYVPTDTLRDHLFAPDCGALAVRALERLEAESGPRSAPGASPAAAPVVVKVLASQQAVTIGHLVAELHRISRTRPLVVYGRSGNARFQATDLRMRSVVWPELDRVPRTPLGVGIRRTYDALAAQLRAGRLG